MLHKFMEGISENQICKLTFKKYIMNFIIMLYSFILTRITYPIYDMTQITTPSGDTNIF